MMNIGEFARLGGVSTRMLRHYDTLRLLAPADVDAHTGRRSYDVAQLTVLNQLVALKGLGFSLDEVGTLLHKGIAPAELHGMLRLREAELERQVRHDRHTLDRVQALFEQVIERMEAADADRTTPIARYTPRQSTQPHAAALTGEPTTQVIAGYAISGAQIPGLHDHVLPATDVAAVIHHGPMATISTAYQELARWAESTARAGSDFTWREHYLEANGEDQSNWIIEVQLELNNPNPTRSRQDLG